MKNITSFSSRFSLWGCWRTDSHEGFVGRNFVSPARRKKGINGDVNLGKEGKFLREIYWREFLFEIFNGNFHLKILLGISIWQNKHWNGRKYVQKMVLLNPEVYASFMIVAQTQCITHVANMLHWKLLVILRNDIKCA